MTEKGPVRASKRQGEYMEQLSHIIALAFHETQKSEEWLKEDLVQEDL